MQVISQYQLENRLSICNKVTKYTLIHLKIWYKNRLLLLAFIGYIFYRYDLQFILRKECLYF